jgi:hypothetical protein
VTTFRQFDGDELERLRRMRECHVADRLTNEELSRAVRLLPLRRTLRSRPRAQLLRIAFATAFGSLLTLGALAATRQLKWVPPFAEVAPTPPRAANSQRALQPTRAPTPSATFNHLAPLSQSHQHRLFPRRPRALELSRRKPVLPSAQRQRASHKVQPAPFALTRSAPLQQRSPST